MEALRQGRYRSDQIRAVKGDFKVSWRVFGRWRYFGLDAQRFHKPKDTIKRGVHIRGVLPSDFELLQQAMRQRKKVIRNDNGLHLNKNNLILFKRYFWRG